MNVPWREADGLMPPVVQLEEFMLVGGPLRFIAIVPRMSESDTNHQHQNFQYP
ncbi:hypothetical protein SAMN05444166_0571 [Singulisphaera sp. GP187]|nr:hypothetical protein SAMN05444166_0571 [Singulisphaera sp. GP187]